ncbi:hypothetical protein [Acidovorax sp.]|uniref:hypothetical protein n=1 Tax=Acidovorax sp. TaxID=1872122 RepID=UPI001AC4C408|nr:hypothetical protein [Acidovorax sp.]MBN9628243.1 hypothetical protein [Acidovorax sp.]
MALAIAVAVDEAHPLSAMPLRPIAAQPMRSWRRDVFSLFNVVSLSRSFRLKLNGG